MGASVVLALPAITGVILLALGSIVLEAPELAEVGAWLFVLGLAILAVTAFTCNLF